MLFGGALDPRLERVLAVLLFLGAPAGIMNIRYGIPARRENDEVRKSKGKESKSMAKGKKVLTTGQVAKICNVASRTVTKWFDKKLLKGYRIPGSKDRRIPVAELVRFMTEYEIPGHEKLSRESHE